MEKGEQSQTGCRMFGRTFGRARPLHATVETKTISDEQKIQLFLQQEKEEEEKQISGVFSCLLFQMFRPVKENIFLRPIFFFFQTFDPPPRRNLFDTVRKRNLFRSRRENERRFNSARRNSNT
jgi:hypothetical protein